MDNADQTPGAPATATQAGNTPPGSPPATPAPGTPAPSGAPSTPSSPVSPELKVEGDKMFVGGKEVVYASDLAAVKEGSEKQLEKAETAHNQALGDLRQELSTAQTNVADLTAKLNTANQASQAGTASTQEADKLKQDLEAANTKVTGAETRILELKRTHLKDFYRVPEEQLKDKTVVQLDALEEALKVVGANRGAGNYAFGAAPGGGAPPETPIDRAKRVLANTPYLGVRNVVQQQQGQ